MSRRGKCNPRNGKGGILLPPNLLVFVLAQLGPGRLALPTSLLDDSQRGAQERGSKVLSLQNRVEQSPRSGKARFPGPTPSSPLQEARPRPRAGDCCADSLWPHGCPKATHGHSPPSREGGATAQFLLSAALSLGADPLHFSKYNQTVETVSWGVVGDC